MSLNLREKYGVEYHNEKLGLTLWLNKSNSFWKVSHVLEWLDTVLPFNEQAKETGNHISNNYWNAFLVAEAFVLDFECENNDNPIVQYLKSRSRFDLESNLEQFQVCLGYDQAMIFNDAYAKTRPEQDTPDTEPTEEEKKRSDNSS